MLPALQHPELLFGICSPVGTDNDRVVRMIRDELKRYMYNCEYFKVTTLMKTIKLKDIPLTDHGIIERYDSYIRYANKVREIFELPYVLAMLCCGAISNFRRKKPNDQDDQKEYIPRQAYVFDQFKRKEEVELLRQVYGRLFILISIYSEKGARIERLINRVSADKGAARPTKAHKTAAQDLVERDEAEEGVPTGQRLQEAFPTADLFIDIDDPASAQRTIVRFFEALFGSNAISPTKEEYGMYAARTAALRSVDLSRQVGAAIMTADGEVITLGCNEVPKAFGGTYWTEDKHDARDFKRKIDENERIKKSLLVDFTKRLNDAGRLKETLSEEDITELILSETGRKGQLRDALLMDLLEFGRIIHAEMSALCDAARLGRAVKAATLYCTTFPCHMCAKHIVAAGVSRVVFIEPYPKSYAEQLHGDAISVGRTPANNRVAFEPFIGIAPYRYRDLFQRDKRKDDSGQFEEWIDGEPQSIVRYTVASYLQNEEAIIKLFSEAAQKKVDGEIIEIVEVTLH